MAKKGKKTEDTWEEGFKYLKKFLAEQGHSKIQPKYITQDGFRLGVWVANQRQKKVTLSKDKIEKLNKINFSWNPLEEAWDEGYKHLIMYFEEHEHTLVPPKYMDY